MTSSPTKHAAIGIDLGTTFSVIAKLDDLGRPVTIPNSEGDNITPSVIFLEDGNPVVGKEAVKAIATDADQVAMCAKRDLGSRFFRSEIGGRQYPPEALQAWVLNKLRLDAEKQVGRCEKVVITVPAYFDEVRRKATQDAGYMAGLDVLDIINEPTAAAVAFGFQQGFMKADGSATEKKKILVYDLGGGTFDVTVMEIGGREFNALATDGDVQLGGRDWDQRLVDLVAQEFITKFGLDPREDPNTAGRLWRDCEDAKRTLSARMKVSIGCDYKGQALRVEVTRPKFEEITRDLLDRTAFTTRQTLQAAGLTWDELDRVLLVGGSSRMASVIELLTNLAGKAPDCSVSPDEAIAHGAALHAGLILSKHRGEAPSFKIKNVNSHSLGVVATDVKTNRERNAVIIPRNTPLPASAKRIFKTNKDGQKSILVRIVEGESTSPDDCSQIGKCTVPRLPPNLPAQTPIEVKFKYEENGRLRVSVHVEGTDASLSHEIMRENSLTQDQLDSWRKYVSKKDPPKAKEAAPAKPAGNLPPGHSAPAASKPSPTSAAPTKSPTAVAPMAKPVAATAAKPAAPAKPAMPAKPAATSSSTNSAKPTRPGSTGGATAGGAKAPPPKKSGDTDEFERLIAQALEQEDDEEPPKKPGRK
ncbi:MAG: Hsp70 family protein [Planctomycetaceae bacterium]